MNQQNGLPGLDIGPKKIQDQSHALARKYFEQLLDESESPVGAEYLALLDEGWFWRDAAYIAWKSIPRALRQPPTERDLCEQLGISQRAMSGRRKKNPAIEARAAKGIVSLTLQEGVDEVMSALLESAGNKNYKNHPDRKLFLEMAGIYQPKQAIALSAESPEPEELSEDELRRRAGLAAAPELPAPPQADEEGDQ